MKHLLTGVAMAAALAIAAPVWAQAPAPAPAPMTPPAAAPKAPAAAPAAPSAATPMAKKPMAKMPMKSMHHHMAMRKHMMGSGDQMTEDLNKQELSRIQGGGAAPAPSGPAPMGGNYPTSGMGSPLAPSAPPPPAK